AESSAISRRSSSRSIPRARSCHRLLLLQTAERRAGDSGTSRPTAHRPSSLLHGLKVDLRHSFADFAPELEPVLAGAAEMDPGIHPRVRALTRRLGKARERSSDAFEGLAARDRETGLVAAQRTREGHRRRRAERALRRRIIRDRRGVLMTVPGRVADRGVVAVVVALTNG